MDTNNISGKVAEFLKKISQFGQRFLSLYSPSTLKEKGWIWAGALFSLTIVVALFFLGVYWSREPDNLNTRTVALDAAQGDKAKIVPGFTTTATLIQVADTLLSKPGGYLSNDKLPPASFFGAFPMLDNIPNWEFGVVTMVRDTSRVLRNDFSRSQSQSLENEFLAQAEPKFNFANDSWLFPPTESEYGKGVEFLQKYLHNLASQSDPNTQFFTRADNLNELLAIIEKRLGNLSQRLNASVEELRVNTDLAGDSAAEQSTQAPGLVIAKTPWMEIDDVFYEARGYVWGLLNILRAVEVDFEKVLQKKNAVASLQQVIRLLEQAQAQPSSPMVLNGDPMGWMANYSKALVSYISPANSAIIDLRNLLTTG
ncbi:MAG: DUF2333 family protein [Gammaproteobacteria bacterium]|nr:DUF2333 family protein [Gammaproteobacteria bacterium]MDH5799651.1 DUF2333 family protein [Gammaproteobacteria bacterium]